MKIIDLMSQKEAFMTLTVGFSDDERLDILRRNGSLHIAITSSGDKIYHFESFTGIRTAFALENGRLIVLGDNTTVL